MNWIDATIVIVLILSMVMGFINGLVKEIASLMALILGIWGAIKFSSFTAAKLYDYFDMTGKYVGIISHYHIYDYSCGYSFYWNSCR
jgi:membrane protein required for colicin V production